MRRWLGFTVALALAVSAWFAWHRPAHPPLNPGAGRGAMVAAAHTRTGTRAPHLAALEREIPADAISPIARDLNAPGGDIRRDLEILNAVFEAWRTNFTGGNPVGENDEITVALAGDNSLRFAFVDPTHPAIDAAGRLCDRWGTPFRFHQLSGTVMEIWSAGPNRRFGDADDAKLRPAAMVP